MVVLEHFSYQSSTGVNMVHGLKCVPKGEIKGVVQIVHGISEHIDRYREFMQFLAENGYACYGEDHLGHGKTCTCEENKGVFCEDDGWGHVVKDLATLHDIAAGQHPGARYIMFGHSMGSFLVRTYIAEYPNGYDAAIISGTGHQSKLLVKAGNIIGSRTVKKNGYASSGKSLQALAMGSYLKRIKNPKTPCDWITRDEKVVEKYMADPMCAFTCKAGLYNDMMKGLAIITDPAVIAKVPKEKPIFFISGAEDPVGDYGKGVQRAYEAFKKAGIKDVSIKLYEGGRHEMLNELNKAEVYSDILSWLNK